MSTPLTSPSSQVRHGGHERSRHLIRLPRPGSSPSFARLQNKTYITVPSADPAVRIALRACLQPGRIDKWVLAPMVAWGEVGDGWRQNTSEANGTQHAGRVSVIGVDLHFRVRERMNLL